MSNPQVIIVGAGPVGLAAAAFLGTAGIRTLVIEQREAPKSGSRAIGIMPPSLEILDHVGVTGALVRAGVRVQTAVVHGKDAAVLGAVHFDDLPGDYPFLLSVPQGETERILRERISRSPHVRLEWNTAAEGLRQTSTRAVVTVRKAGKTEEIEAPFVLSCDGDHSTLRGAAGISAAEKRYAHTFVMGDFTDTSDLGAEAHLYFTRFGAVESFPLPGAVRRWIVQTDNLPANPPPTFITEKVTRRTGRELDPTLCRWISPFGIKRRLSDTYCSDRLLLVGDAAHVMPPIGGQGMNTGFADAWMAVELLTEALRGRPHAPLFALYDRCRRKAAAAAASRAALSMGVGTLRGAGLSFSRNVLIRPVLHPNIAKRLARRFAMLTVPFGTMESMRAAIETTFPPIEAP